MISYNKITVYFENSEIQDIVPIDSSMTIQLAIKYLLDLYSDSKDYSINIVLRIKTLVDSLYDYPDIYETSDHFLMLKYEEGVLKADFAKVSKYTLKSVESFTFLENDASQNFVNKRRNGILILKTNSAYFCMKFLLKEKMPITDLINLNINKFHKLQSSSDPEELKKFNLFQIYENDAPWNQKDKILELTVFHITTDCFTIGYGQCQKNCSDKPGFYLVDTNKPDKVEFKCSERHYINSNENMVDDFKFLALYFFKNSRNYARYIM